MDPTLDLPTSDPVLDPTMDPTLAPSTDPVLDPTVDPTLNPMLDPTLDPSMDPTLAPTSAPTLNPSLSPTTEPSVSPTVQPTTTEPSVSPTEQPSTTEPSVSPTAPITVTGGAVLPCRLGDDCCDAWAGPPENWDWQNLVDENYFTLGHTCGPNENNAIELYYPSSSLVSVELTNSAGYYSDRLTDFSLSIMVNNDWVQCGNHLSLDTGSGSVQQYNECAMLQMISEGIRIESNIVGQSINLAQVRLEKEPGCAEGYYEQEGDYPGWTSVNGRGGGESVQSCNHCAEICDSEPLCRAYECSHTQLKCNLVDTSDPTVASFQDYKFCTKNEEPTVSECPHGYSQVGTLSENNDVAGAGLGQSQQNSIADCKNLCDATTNCVAFMYGGANTEETSTVCELSGTVTPNNDWGTNFRFCRKTENFVGRRLLQLIKDV